ncbi:protein-cysteine N-palmitoyltransferase Rasp-like [Culicoides brevitarsis]|uniref:protein-cysteine N-palmitoyltransferase Rasp-like n=1 Tax=Culicoides brevitarsis TaxID=469753 RepID=UPI00307C4976
MSSQYLPKIESFAFLTFYIVVLLKSIKNVSLVCNSEIPGYTYFDQGWNFLGRKRDNNDYEWETWSLFVRETIQWYFFYVISSEIHRISRIKQFSWFSFLFGSVFFYFQIGSVGTCIFLVKALLFFWTIRYKKKYLIWISVGFWMLLMNINAVEDMFYYTFEVDEQKVYMLYVALGWQTLKCVSFAMDKIEDGEKSLFYGLKDYLGYIFYPPTIFMGPICVFGRHREMLLKESAGKISSGTFSRTKFLIFNLLRCLTVFLITQFALHYLYINNFQFYHKQIFEKLTTFGLYGYGYLMGQFFHHKYVIFYGFGIALGEFDNISMPNRPKCIARINRYTDMWKHFDHGLYEFLFKYIYAQLCPKKAPLIRKFLSSLVTFAFIYLWHGLYKSIFIWSLLNYCCVVVENLMYSFMESKKYKEKMEKFMSGNNLLRFNALIATNVMIPAILSNFIFFAGTDVGYEFFRKTYLSGVWFYVKLLAICYSLYTTNEWIRRSEQKKILKSSE